jgi:hypothetical protein
VILVHSHLGLEWGATAAQRAEWASAWSSICPRTRKGNGGQLARLAEVAEFIRGVAANEGRTLVVANKRVRCALTGPRLQFSAPPSADTLNSSFVTSPSTIFVPSEHR